MMGSHKIHTALCTHATNESKIHSLEEATHRKDADLSETKAKLEGTQYKAKKAKRQQREQEIQQQRNLNLNLTLLLVQVRPPKMKCTSLTLSWWQLCIWFLNQAVSVM
jgi:hypothetical protein